MLCTGLARGLSRIEDSLLYVGAFACGRDLDVELQVVWYYYLQ